MASMVARSSLEMMLDALRQRDERPKDLPPALPARPTMRGRLPTSRRSLLPVNLKLESSAPTRSLLNNSVKWEDEKDAQTLRNDRDVALKSENFECQMISKVEQQIESPYSEMPDLVSFEEKLQVADGSDSPVGPLPSAVVLDEKQGCGGVIKYCTSEVAGSEDARNQTLQRVLWVQKNYRGLRARSHYQQLKKGAATLQSFVRGERARHNFEVLIKRWRAAALIQKHVRQWLARTTSINQQKDIILLQSVIRGWLARKHFTVLKKLDMSRVSHTVLKKREASKIIHVKLKRGSARDPPEFTKDTSNEHPQIQPSVLAELQSQVCKAEAALRGKEEENAILKQQLKEYETRWSEYELKMKSMEKTWQKQLTSLQMNFAAARKSLVLEEIIKQPGGLDSSKINHYYEAEDTESAVAQTAVAQMPKETVAKLPNASDNMPVRNNDNTHNAVIQLMKEFDQRRQVFDDDVGLLIEVKSAQLGANINSYEELQKLKARFASWKKDYKMRLRDTKTALLKLVNPKKKTYKKWLCAVSTR